MNVRASQLLRIRKLWIGPIFLVGVVIALVAAIYFGSVVNPTGHLHNLPVMVVNEDAGGTANGQRVDVGASLVSALEQSSDVTSRLKLRNTTLGQAQASMDRGGAYAALVIPATLSQSALLAAGTGSQRSGVPAR